MPAPHQGNMDEVKRNLNEDSNSEDVQEQRDDERLRTVGDDSILSEEQRGCHGMDRCKWRKMINDVRSSGWV